MKNNNFSNNNINDKLADFTDQVIANKTDSDVLANDFYLILDLQNTVININKLMKSKEIDSLELKILKAKLEKRLISSKKNPISLDGIFNSIFFSRLIPVILALGIFYFYIANNISIENNFDILGASLSISSYLPIVVLLVIVIIFFFTKQK